MQKTTWTLTLPRGRVLELDSRPRVMGVLNITPDSFSDGGLWLEPERAIEQGLRMVEEGADLLDLGAESTRPGGGVYGEGARELGVDEEAERLLPVLEALRQATEVPLSVDTRKGGVARLALEAGADLINDVGGLADEEMVDVVAEAGCPLILMHSRGDLGTMQRGIHFEDVVQDVGQDLEARLKVGVAGGIAREQVVLDPGIGFGKRVEHNLDLLARTDEIARLGRPILLGASRKSFIHDVQPAPPQERLGGSLAAVEAAARCGASIVRVHDVQPTVQFLGVRYAIQARMR